MLNAILIIDVHRDLACNSRTEFKITQIIQDAKENDYMKHKEQGFLHVYIINSKNKSLISWNTEGVNIVYTRIEIGKQKASMSLFVRNFNGQSCKLWTSIWMPRKAFVIKM